MLIEISQALSSMKAMTDLVTLLSKTKTDSAITDKAIKLQSIIISLQSAIMTIQSQHQALQAENDELKKQLTAIENWQSIASNYFLTEIASGVFVYAAKETLDLLEPVHWLCTNCFSKKQKSILQFKEMTSSGTIYSCPSCSANIVDHSKKRTINVY